MPQTSLELLKLTIQTYRMKNKESEMKLRRVSADLSNDLKSIILGTDQKKTSPLMRLYSEEQQKYLQSFQNNAKYRPINPDTDVTYQKVNLFSSENFFVYCISYVPHYIWWNQHNIVYSVLVKLDVLDTCGAMICSYFRIAFPLFFMKIENAVYTFCQNCTLLFINGLIFDIMNIQNNRSLEFEWTPMLALLRFVNDRRFSWLPNVFLNFFQVCLSSVQQCQGNFTKDDVQKMFITSCQTYEGLNISINSIIEDTQFFLWQQVKYALTERFCHDLLENWFGKQRSLGSRKDNPSMADFGYNNNAIRNQKNFKRTTNSNVANSSMIALTDEILLFYVENLKKNESLNINLE